MNFPLLNTVFPLFSSIPGSTSLLNLIIAVFNVLFYGDLEKVNGSNMLPVMFEYHLNRIF